MYDAPRWCKMKHGRKAPGTVDVKPKAVRLSVTVPTNHHESLDRIARQKKVSVAWVIREAVEKYLTLDPTLFDKTE